MTALPIKAQEAQKLFKMLQRFPHLALAVSGGPDSLALMHLAAGWREDQSAALKLSVLTVDHGLRAQSRDEALMVGRMAQALGLPHTILTWEGGGGQTASLQARARAARYDLMAGFCHAHDIQGLVTAHTQDDQAETFLMRLKRGSGLDGLAAIPERGAWAGIAVLRPLLDVPKARLVATLNERGIGFASDPSNADPRFERVRVRRSGEALSALGLTPEALALSARRLRRAREVLDHAAHSFLSASSETSEAGYSLIDRAALASAPQEIALRALSYVIARVGGGEEPVRLAKLEALLASLAENPEQTHTLGRCRLGPISGRLGIFREIRAKGLPVARLEPGGRTLWDNRFRIELGPGETEPVTVRGLGELGFAALRDRSDVAASLPRLAGRTLPGCWRGEDFIGVPALGNMSDLGQRASFDCRARFVSAEGVSSGGERGSP